MSDPSGSSEGEPLDLELSADQEERARRLHSGSIDVDMLFQGPCGSAAFAGEIDSYLRSDYRRDGDAYRAFTVARNLPDRMAVLGKSDLFREWWEASGVTVGSRECGNGTFEQVLAGVGNVTLTFDGLDWLSKALKAQQIRDAKAHGKRAGFMHMQNTLALEQKLDRLDLFYDLGVRMVQLTYNSDNLVGGGSLDRSDAGLSYFGVKVVHRMNDLGMVVDTGHTGNRSTLDACEVSRAPVIASHTAARTLSGHPRARLTKPSRPSPRRADWSAL